MIEYAYDKAIYAANPAAMVGIERTTFNSIGNYGVEATSGQIAVEYCTFDQYGNSAVHVTGSASVTAIHSNFLDSNSDYGIRNDTTNWVNGQGNWWGDATGPSTVGSGSGVKVSDYVDYTPWATSQVTTPVPGGPTITSQPNLYAVAGQSYQYDADGRASAGGSGAMTWSKVYGPDSFSIDPSTGQVSWVPTSVGSYLIGILVEDDEGVDTQLFEVQVDMLGDTAPPQVSSFSYSFTGGPGLLDAELVATFNEPVLVDAGDIAIVDSGDNIVAFDSYTYSQADHRLTVNVSGLTEGETYRLFLTDTITDIAFNPLDGEFDGYTFPTGDGAAGGMFAVSFTAVPDKQPPVVTGIELNNHTTRTVSSIEPGDVGVQTIEVTFSEAVEFTAGDVVVREVTFPGGTEMLGDVLTPTSITGNGTDTMTVTFDSGSVVNTWVKVTLNGSVSIEDLAGNVLDGEPAASGSGRGYIYDAAVDLPTGDGTAGGDAVFYVGSMRGDTGGDGKTNIFDLLKVRQNYLKPPGPDRDDNADVTGDGNVNIFDLLLVRQNYLSELDDLPTSLSGVPLGMASASLSTAEEAMGVPESATPAELVAADADAMAASNQTSAAAHAAHKPVPAWLTSAASSRGAGRRAASVDQADKAAPAEPLGRTKRTAGPAASGFADSSHRAVLEQALADAEAATDQPDTADDWVDLLALPELNPLVEV